MVTLISETLFDRIRPLEAEFIEAVGAAVAHSMSKLSDAQLAELSIEWAKTHDAELQSAAA